MKIQKIGKFHVLDRVNYFEEPMPEKIMINFDLVFAIEGREECFPNSCYITLPSHTTYVGYKAKDLIDYIANERRQNDQV